jgi:hypothetical protein
MEYILAIIFSWIANLFGVSSRILVRAFGAKAPFSPHYAHCPCVQCCRACTTGAAQAKRQSTGSHDCSAAINNLRTGCGVGKAIRWGGTET